MKDRIKKIMILAAVLLFVTAGISFADDRQVGARKAPGNAYRHYKKGSAYQPYRNKRPADGYRPPSYSHGYYHDRNYCRKEVYQHYNYPHYQRYPLNSMFFFGFSVYEPYFAVSVGMTGYK